MAGDREDINGSNYKDEVPGGCFSARRRDDDERRSLGDELQRFLTVILPAIRVLRWITVSRAKPGPDLR